MLFRSHDEAGVGERLGGDARARILLEDRIEDCIRDLVGDLVGVAFGDGLGREEEVVRHFHKLLDVARGVAETVSGKAANALAKGFSRSLVPASFGERIPSNFSPTS